MEREKQNDRNEEDAATSTRTTEKETETTERETETKPVQTTPSGQPGNDQAKPVEGGDSDK